MRFKVNWDYTGWKEFPSRFGNLMQNDWNSTLITMINNLRKLIIFDNENIQLNIIKTNSILVADLLSNMLFYHEAEGAKYLGDYEIEVDDTVPLNEIHLYDKTSPEEYNGKVIIENL
ncbi:MAG: hypothetical protein E6R13_08500 [Spirochaetes bacterium]|nr:MAG: hypothetical protein E6R13_08500 [Spirochaetota bacterium]